MMRNYLHIKFIFIVLPFFGFGQIQIGQDIYGEYNQDGSGRSVSLSSDGSILAIGAYRNLGINGPSSGHVRVFRKQSDSWIQIGSDIDGEGAGDYSGESVSLSSDGSILAIGAILNDSGYVIDSGHVRVYRNQSDNWVQIGNDIDGEGYYERSGSSVSLSADGSIVAIGAYLADGMNGPDSGIVRVFKNESDNWVQVGSNIDGEAEGDVSGSTSSVSLSSDGLILAIGAFRNSANGTNSGHVRIYQNQTNNWVQVGSDIDGEEGTNSGLSVSLSSDGSIVAIGSPYIANSTNFGYVRVFRNESGSWVQVGSDINGNMEDGYFGRSVSLSSDGSIVAIGAPFNSIPGLTDAGVARVFYNQSGSWIQIGSDIEGIIDNGRLGSSISLSSNGSTVAIGSFNIFGFGYARIFDISTLLSINDIDFSNFELFPNPAKNQFTVQLNQNLTLEKVNVFNNLGQFFTSTKDNIVNTSKLSSGLYYVEVITNQGKATKKLIIE